MRLCLGATCHSMVYDHGEWCEVCDRSIREQTRSMNGIRPFTDQEYRQLRKQLYGRPARRVLLVVPR